MTIPVTTRAGNGAPLNNTQMDTNLTNLARDATEAVQGNVRLANETETNAGSSTTLGVNPANLDTRLTTLTTDVGSSDITAAAIGSITLNGDIILKWGNGAILDGGSTTFNFAVAFPNNAFQVIACFRDASAPVTSLNVTSVTASGFTITVSGGSSSDSIAWFAIGN